MNFIQIVFVMISGFISLEICYSKQLFFPRPDLQISELNIWEIIFSSHYLKTQQFRSNHDTNQIVSIPFAPSFPTAVAQNISQQCIEDSLFYVNSFYRNRSLWALQMQESSGHLPPGIFGSDNIHADGLFDECLSIRAPFFNGKYCTVFFKSTSINPQEIISVEDTNQTGVIELSNVLTLIHLLGLTSGSDRVEPQLSVADSGTSMLPSISFCLPSSCSAEDLGQSVAQQIGSYIFANNKSIVTVADPGYCFEDLRTPNSFDGAEITVIIVLSLLALLVLSATLHEAWRMYCNIEFDKERDGKAIYMLHCFSALENGRRILNMDVLVSNDNLGCIHGIRFISTCWVVMGHTFSYAAYKVMNPKAISTDALQWSMQVILNGTLSVDTFFTISGLLVSYLLLRQLDHQKGRVNFGLFYLHRYLRLTPVYAFVFAYFTTLIIYLGTGPNWYSVVSSANECRTVWWKHFLYFNNLIPMEAQCMAHTWYLAVDMQLFLVSPLLIYPLWRWNKLGLGWLFLVAVASHASIVIAYAVYDLMPTLIFTRPAEVASSSLDYYRHYYMTPWTRAPPYLVGIFVGWYLNKTKSTETRVPKTYVTLGWILSTVIGLAVLFGMSPFLDPSEVEMIPVFIQFAYGTFHRTAWAMVIGWIVFACSRGCGGFVQLFLSWRGFLPLSRLTYCVYLIHYDFLNAFYSAHRKQFYYTKMGVLTTSFGIIFTSFGLAFLVSTTIEASFLNLEKMMLPSKQRPSKIQNTLPTGGNESGTVTKQT